MNILILGATGRTGQHLIRQAMANHHTVTAFGRSPQRLIDEHRGVHAVEGDVTSSDQLASALVGQDAIISVLGTTHTSDQLVSQSTAALINAAQRVGVRRIIVLSTFLITPNATSHPVLKLVRGLMHGNLADRTIAEAMLRQSELDWTIVYATALDRYKPTGHARVVHSSERLGIRSGISRKDVAVFMVRIVPDAATYRQALLITAPR